MDAYKQSFYRGSEVNQSLVHRMSWVYRRAGLAMLITSLTTAVSFFANLTSGFIGVQTFGIFSGLLVICNYVNMLTLFPALLLLHERHLKDTKTSAAWCTRGPAALWRAITGKLFACCREENLVVAPPGGLPPEGP